jgi:hypothetical protein
MGGVRMGVGVYVEVEGIDETGIELTCDEKLLAEVIGDITESEETLTNQLAKEYGFDIRPLSLIADEDDSPQAAWQDPISVMQAAKGLSQAFDKKGSEIIGKEISYNELTAEDIDIYKLALDDVIKTCQFAKDKGRRVRLFVC